MPDIFNRVHTLFTNKDSTGLLRNENLGDLYFGQLHPLHQDLFDNLYGQHTRIRLKDLPHYTFWRDKEHKNIEKAYITNIYQRVGSFIIQMTTLERKG